MNEENDLMTKTSIVEGSIERVTCKEMVIAIKAMKLRKLLDLLKYVEK